MFLLWIQPQLKSVKSVGQIVHPFCSTMEISPSFGYYATQKTRCFGYKLHPASDKNEIFHSYDFTPANIHDINDIKDNFENCLLIGDRGYISKELQADLFNYSNIKFSVPMRKSKHGFVEFSKKKSKRELKQLFLN